MRRSPRNALLHEAGRLHVLREELASLEQQRDQIEQRIRLLERNVADAEKAFDATVEKMLQVRSDADGSQNGDDIVVMNGKLPHRVLSAMRRDPSRLYTASELSEQLSVRDTQQVRTALARLVRKGLVRRSGVKGEFTV